MALLFVPMTSNVQADPCRPYSPAQEIVQPSNVPRVYGENLALDIFSHVTTNGYRESVREFTENGSRWILDATMALTGHNLEARNY